MKVQPPPAEFRKAQRKLFDVMWNYCAVAKASGLSPAAALATVITTFMSCSGFILERKPLRRDLLVSASNEALRVMDA